MDDLYTIGFTRKQYPDNAFFEGAKGSAAYITNMVRDKYIKERRSVIWDRKAALSTYRMPYPWPVRSAEWKGIGLSRADWTKFVDTLHGKHRKEFSAMEPPADGKPWVVIVLPGGWAVLRLRGGPEFGRQMASFRQVVSGQLPKRQLFLRKHIVSGQSHRTGTGGRDSGDRVMVKMVADMPVREPRSDRVLTLCVDPATFWVAELDGRTAWVANSDHVRRAMDWLGIHHDRLQRLRQDAKAERRLCVKKTRQWQASLDRCCLKHARRMSSWLHEMAAHVIGFCERQGVAELVYDDSKREGLPLFPWYKLKTLLGDKCAVAGIALKDMAPQLGTEDSYEEALATCQEGE